MCPLPPAPQPYLISLFFTLKFTDDDDDDDDEDDDDETERDEQPSDFFGDVIEHLEQKEPNDSISGNLCRHDGLSNLKLLTVSQIHTFLVGHSRRVLPEADIEAEHNLPLLPIADYYILIKITNSSPDTTTPAIF